MLLHSCSFIPATVSRVLCSNAAASISRGDAMETQTTNTFATFGRRKARSCICIVDRKPHIRTFLRNSLEELEFATCECGENAQVEAALQEHRPDLVVLGLSAGGEQGVQVLNTLAAKKFAGKVLLLGPRVSPMVRALQQLGEQLKLEMLPVLS